MDTLLKSITRFFLIKTHDNKRNMNGNHEEEYMAPLLSLTVLVDNNTLTDHYFSGEPGLSFLITTQGKKILFDTGYSDLFLKNAQGLGEDLLDLDMVVLSHGHLDHTGGLPDLVRHLTRAIIEEIPARIPTIIAHPYCFFPRPKQPIPNIGSILPEDELKRQFSVVTSTSPQWLTDDLVFLGQIERKFDFEYTTAGKRKILMPDGSLVDDQLLDDTALALRTDKGLVIITGCSHSGICNIVDHAKRVCGEERVIDIIGGLHLLAPERPRLEKTVSYLKNLDLESLHACHCTSLSSKIALAGGCPLQEVGVGMTLTWGSSR
jgi:7,8-dihydropterin-6-yl-methyl-4-(beta-D-ribofuranosyl)aminobenzene 5'-phosphate synthase